MSMLKKRLIVFPWNKNFETGIETIDRQHQKLVDILNQLAATLIYDDQSEMVRVLEELKEYANYHFECEEALWEEYFEDDSWFTSHQLNHAGFLPNITDLSIGGKALPTREVGEAIVRFLIRWLALHIIDEDKRMSEVIRAIETGHSLEEAKKIAERKMNASVRVIVDALLQMYDNLSARNFDLMRERLKREQAEAKLQEAYEDLQKVAVTDKLTGLYNRHYLDEVFEKELRRAVRARRNIAFIMLDVDFFKRLNDYYGHAAGDQALAKIGQCLIDTCRRPTDHAFRLGGEEFGILTTEDTPNGAVQFAEIIRQNIEKLAIPHIKSELGNVVTMSLGVVSKPANPDDNLDAMIKLADQRLYQAKQSGRNKVISC